MNILILGATGRVGSQIVTYALHVNVNPKVDHVAHVKVDHPLVTSNMFL
ncbi:Uncharacterised protein [Cytobacillus firmus]|nr:Uncharacterised protein [Cytobacillus firmus]